MNYKLKKFVVAFIIYNSAFIISGSAQGTWNQKANFAGTGRQGPVAFSIGTKGYIGTGYDGTYKQDFWEWDQATNVWTQKANFGGTPRFGAAAFSIGTKGYIGTGSDGTFRQDFWEWDQTTNVWIQKTSLPGTQRYQAVGFSIGTKGYIGLGSNGSGTFYQDLWEYNSLNDSWTQKANFYEGRGYAASFSIGTKGYVCCGADAITSFNNDLWEWDQTTDQWAQKASCPGNVRYLPVGFSIGGKGYIGVGDYDTGPVQHNLYDFWEWNQASNTWTQRINYPGAGSFDAAGFSIGGKGYIGTGSNISSYANDFWEFTPPSSCNIALSITVTNSACSMATGTASVVATGGSAPYTYAWTNGDKASLADTLAASLYMVVVTDASGCTAQAPAMVNDAGAPTISITSVTNVSCNGGSNGAITSSASGGTPPYSFFWDNGATTANMSGLQAGPHLAQVTDANGCHASTIVNITEPAKITLTDSVLNASCGNTDGAMWAIVSGGTAPYSYLWSTSASTQSISNIPAGSYSVLITDSSGCTKNGMGTIINIGGAFVTIDSIISAGCSSGTGAIYITPTQGSPPYSYLWTNGATTQDLIGVVPGNYGLTIYGTNSCATAFSTSIPSQLPLIPSICIVTVDTATGKNVCLFTKDSIANLHLKQYNFYRETTTAGVYQLLGTKPANQLSVWTDQSANPLQRAWRYKVTAEDSCGNESPLSAEHKTIHLAANLGVGNVVNLNWDNYEGFSYGTFIIYRYTPATGWDSLDAVPSNLNSYTDLNPPTMNNLFYYVAVPHASCIASIINPKDPQIFATNFNLSRSNTYRINPTPTSVSDGGNNPDVKIFPNPTNGYLRIEINEIGFANSELKIYNVYGQEVFTSFILTPKFQINLSAQPAGIYFLQVKTQKGFAVRKIVKQ